MTVSTQGHHSPVRGSSGFPLSAEVVCFVGFLFVSACPWVWRGLGAGSHSCLTVEAVRAVLARQVEGLAFLREGNKGKTNTAIPTRYIYSSRFSLTMCLSLVWTVNSEEATILYSALGDKGGCCWDIDHTELVSSEAGVGALSPKCVLFVILQPANNASDKKHFGERSISIFLT